MIERIDFICVGTQKAGTTALYHYLKNHEEISLSSIKETHFFCKEKLEDLNKDYEEYHSYFDFDEKIKKKGEITPDYLYYKDAPRRISQYNPDIKIIVILREPVARAYSQWNMNRHYKLESRSFFRSFVTDFLKSIMVPHNNNITTTYFRKGLYSYQLNEYLKYFDPSQILILNHSFFLKNQVEVLNMVFSHIGVSNYAGSTKKIEANDIQYQSSLSSGMKFIYKCLYLLDQYKIKQILKRFAKD